MSGNSNRGSSMSEGFAFDAFDPDTVGRIDVHLERAQQTDDSERKDFHLRHARQLLEATKG